MLEEVEQERDEANNLVSQLQEELKNTKEILKNNQMNLIEPLQNRITDLERLVEEKEGDIKKRYKRKLRKYKREIEIERSINEKLKDKLSKNQTKLREDHYPSRLYHIDTISNGEETEDLNKSKKYASENENKRYLSNKASDNRITQIKNKNHIIVKNIDEKCEVEIDKSQLCNPIYTTSTQKPNPQNSQTVRRNKSQTLTGNRALNIEELFRNNTPSHMSTHKNLREYLMKIETSM